VGSRVKDDEGSPVDNLRSMARYSMHISLTCNKRTISHVLKLANLRKNLKLFISLLHSCCHALFLYC
jgi:hypothetical protein